MQKLQEMVHSIVTGSTYRVGAYGMNPFDDTLSQIQGTIYGKFLTYLDAAIKRAKTRDYSEIQKEIEKAEAEQSARDKFDEAWNKKWKFLDGQRREIDDQMKRFPYIETMGVTTMISETAKRKSEFVKWIDSADRKLAICENLKSQFIANAANPVKGWQPSLPQDFSRQFSLQQLPGSSIYDKCFRLVFKYFYNSSGVSENPPKGKFFQELEWRKSEIKSMDENMKKMKSVLSKYQESNRKHDALVSRMNKLEKAFDALEKSKAKRPWKQREDFFANRIQNLRNELATSDYAKLQAMYNPMVEIYRDYSSADGGPIMQRMAVELKRISNGAWYDYQYGDLTDDDRQLTVDNLYNSLTEKEWRGTQFENWIDSPDTPVNEIRKALVDKINMRISMDLKGSVDQAFLDAMQKKKTMIHLEYKDDENGKDPLENLGATDYVEDASTAFEKVMSDGWSDVKKMIVSDIDSLVTRCLKYWRGANLNATSGYNAGARFPKMPLSGWVNTKQTFVEPKMDSNGVDWKDTVRHDINTGVAGYYLPAEKMKGVWKKLLLSVIQAYDSELFLKPNSNRDSLKNKIKGMLRTTKSWTEQADAIMDLVDLFVCEKAILSFKVNSKKISNEIEEIVGDFSGINIFIRKFNEQRNRLIRKLNARQNVPDDYSENDVR